MYVDALDVLGMCPFKVDIQLALAFNNFVEMIVFVIVVGQIRAHVLIISKTPVSAC
jgi:hypothetical protein